MINITLKKISLNFFSYSLKRVERIELSSLAWKAKVLPLNYTRFEYNQILNETPKRVNFKLEQGKISDKFK